MAAHFHFELISLLWALAFASLDGIRSLIQSFRSRKRQPYRKVYLLALDNFATTGALMVLVTTAISFVRSFLPSGFEEWYRLGAILLLMLLIARRVPRWISDRCIRARQAAGSASRR